MVVPGGISVTMDSHPQGLVNSEETDENNNRPNRLAINRAQTELDPELKTSRSPL